MPRRASKRPSPGRKRARRAQPWWSRLPDEELLQLRFCDLGLTVRGSPLQHHVERLYRELDERGIALMPHCWVGEEWFSPDGVPGIAVPSYLLHPRLRCLERPPPVRCRSLRGPRCTCSGRVSGIRSPWRVSA